MGYEIRSGFIQFCAIFGTLLLISVLGFLAYGAYDAFFVDAEGGLPFLVLWPFAVPVFLTSLPFLLLGFWPDVGKKRTSAATLLAATPAGLWIQTIAGSILVSIGAIFPFTLLAVGFEWFAVFVGSVILTIGVLLLRLVQKKEPA